MNDKDMAKMHADSNLTVKTPHKEFSYCVKGMVDSFAPSIFRRVYGRVVSFAPSIFRRVYGRVVYFPDCCTKAERENRLAHTLHALSTAGCVFDTWTTLGTSTRCRHTIRCASPNCVHDLDETTCPFQYGRKR